MHPKVLPLRHPYLNKEDGWEIAAGQDVKRSRYMLVVNRRTETEGSRAAVLTALRPKASLWTTFAEGKTKDMLTVFEKIGEDFEV